MIESLSMQAFNKTILELHSGITVGKFLGKKVTVPPSLKVPVHQWLNLGRKLRNKTEKLMLIKIRYPNTVTVLIFFV